MGSEMCIRDRVQARLNAHGFQVAEDGLFSGGTRLALRAFQKVAGLQATGTVTPKTAEALRREVGSSRFSAPASIPVLPLWLAELRRRQGLHEVRDRKTLMAWLRSDGQTLGYPAMLPWC